MRKKCALKASNVKDLITVFQYSNLNRLWVFSFLIITHFCNKRQSKELSHMGVVKVLSSSLTACQQTKWPFFIKQSRQGAEAISLMCGCVELERGYFPKKR